MFIVPCIDWVGVGWDGTAYSVGMEESGDGRLVILEEGFTIPCERLCLGTIEFMNDMAWALVPRPWGSVQRYWLVEVTCGWDIT